jgi:hypothetical protein
MLYGPLDQPAQSQRRTSGFASTPRVWLAAARKRFSQRPAQQLTPAPRDPEREADAVRSLAYAYLGKDPRFAQELFAAAERHERADHNKRDPKIGQAPSDGAEISCG